jgi:hypothetical protein
LHYHSDVDGLIVVLDSDLTSPHTPEHEPDYTDQKCRLCQLRRTIGEVTRHLRPRSDGTSLMTAIGLAVPQIEAWYLCGVPPQPSEAGWLAADSGSRHKYKASLKLSAYGIDRAPLALTKFKAVEHATRLAGRIDLLEVNFPNGFCPLSTEIRSWLNR